MTAITKKPFGTTQNGEEASLYTLKSERLEYSVTDFGANVVSIIVPDREGNASDVALGYDSISDYERNGCFFGSCVGPNANRIGKARFTIGEKEYRLAENSGPNNLHSDFDKGFHKRMWNASIKGEELVMTLHTGDGEMGFPGELDAEVSYSIDGDNGLKIHYNVTTDRPALINPTNHSYFNLAGEGNGTILDHVIRISASHYTPVVEGAIPTGEIAPVAGTPLDLTKAVRIGDRIDEDFEQLKLVQGYDHNWVIDGADGTLRSISEVYEPVSGRRMEVLTDLPGVQFYAGNCIVPDTGKGGKHYDARYALCLETQFFPDSINHDSFPDVVFTPDRPYVSTTIYRFSAE